MLRVIFGAMSAPHELLLVLGYRLAGIRCLYRWGDHSVKAIGPVSRRAAIVGVLLPFAVALGLQVLFLGLMLAAYAVAQQTPIAERLWTDLSWTLLFAGLSVICCIYVGSSVSDLRKAIRLLTRKPVKDPN